MIHYNIQETDSTYLSLRSKRLQKQTNIKKNKEKNKKNQANKLQLKFQISDVDAPLGNIVQTWLLKGG